jgi:hypothetical protein
MIAVIPTYTTTDVHPDPHLPDESLKEYRSRLYAEEMNKLLLNNFKQKGVVCSFEPEHARRHEK